ncbi:MAG TPA: polysaccharide biosynthesis/export family protein [Terriglobales bacterium]|nr:polysaccharide biosynthesis/export family protein [Terriglobales bacterium]
MVRIATCGTVWVALCATILPAQTPQQAGVAAGTVFPGVTAASTEKEAASPAGGGDSALRLGAGDLIEVSVYDVPELNTKTRVGSSGDVYLPLISYVHVDGLTVSEAEKVIEKRLDQGGFVRNPHVQILVQEYTSNGASVLGEVVKPGVYPVMGEQTLFSIISAAGGLSDRAGKTVTITRHDHPDKPVKVTVSRNMEDHPESNVPVYAGDIVMVRRADVIYIVGDVARPSGFLMDNNDHLTVLQAIALAGGTTSTAKLNSTRIIRKGPAGVTEIPVPLKQVLQAKADDVALQADDILFIPTSARKALQGRTADAALQFAAAATLVAIR